MGRSGLAPRLALLVALLTAGCGKEPAPGDSLLDTARAATVFDEGVKKAAQAELVRMAPVRLPDFVALLENPDTRLADVAGMTLMRVDVRSVAPRLREVMKGTNRVAAFWAARALSPLDPIETPMLDLMAFGLESGSLDMQDEALAVLATRVPPGSPPPPRRLLDALGKALRDQATTGTAAVVLSRYGAAAVPTLVAALDDSVASLWAIGALGTIGPLAGDAIPALERALQRDWGDLGLRRAKAAEALRRIRDE